MENEKVETAAQTEEAIPNIVFVRAKKKKKEMRSLQPTIQVLVSFITAIVAVSGIILSYMSARTQWNAARSNRFTSAIEHLKDESLAIRMGALFELKKLGQASKNEQEDILRLLNPFIREGIENPELLLLPNTEKDFSRPQEDIFIACDLVAQFWFQGKSISFWELMPANWVVSGQSECSISLEYLRAERINLEGITLTGAYLPSANLQGAYLRFANLQKTRLEYAELQRADLVCANLQEAKLICANLSNADLTSANLQGARLGNADLREASFLYSDLTGADLYSANLQGAYLSKANLSGASLGVANLQGADLWNTDLSNASLYSANLKKSSLRGTFFQNADLTDANLQGADLRGAYKLTTTQLLDAYIDDTTILDDEFASDPLVQAHILACRKTNWLDWLDWEAEQGE